MKRILGILLVLTAFGVNAQQKLIGSNIVQYNESGDVIKIDSNEYIYNSWGGSIYSNELEFRFENSEFNWQDISLPWTWDVENHYYGNSQPLSLISTRNNTISGDMVTVSESSSDRFNFTYDSAGNLLSQEYFYFDGTSFVPSTGHYFEYDANNNKVVQEFVAYAGASSSLQSVDSFFYDTSNKLINFRKYELHFTNVLYLLTEGFLTYSGSEISNIKIYHNNGVTITSPMEWSRNIDYSFSNGQPASILTYNVSNGVPESTPWLELYASYGSNNKILLYERYVDGDWLNQSHYFYDGQNFLKEIVVKRVDNSLSLYTSKHTKYYYQNTAGIDEEELAEATVFPNPSSDFVTISTDSEIDKVAVFNSNGLIVISQNGGDLDISKLSAGVYLAQVKTSTGFAQARFVKQ